MVSVIVLSAIMPSAIMLSAIMLSVVTLSVITLSVVAPGKRSDLIKVRNITGVKFLKGSLQQLKVSLHDRPKESDFAVPCDSVTRYLNRISPKFWKKWPKIPKYLHQSFF